MTSALWWLLCPSHTTAFDPLKQGGWAMLVKKRTGAFMTTRRRNWAGLKEKELLDCTSHLLWDNVHQTAPLARGWSTPGVWRSTGAVLCPRCLPAISNNPNNPRLLVAITSHQQLSSVHESLTSLSFVRGRAVTLSLETVVTHLKWSNLSYFKKY